MNIYSFCHINKGEKLKRPNELVKEKISQFRKVTGYKKKLVLNAVHI